MVYTLCVSLLFDVKLCELQSQKLCGERCMQNGVVSLVLALHSLISSKGDAPVTKCGLVL